MSVAIRAITRIQDADDVNVTPAVGVDEYALVYDHDTAKFVLRAPAAPFAGILATGATTGATSQAQAFTLGVVSPFDAPAADSTTAWQVRKADKTTAVVNVDTTNSRVGIGTAAPSANLHGPGNTTDVDTVRFYGGVSGYTSTYLAINRYGSLNSYIKTNEANLAAIAIAAESGDTSGRFVMGLDTGVPFIGMGPGNAARDIFLRRESGALAFRFGTTPAEKMRITAAGLVGIGATAPATRLDIDAGALTMAEMTAPTGVANKAMLYTKDNGSGKTQLCCKLGDDVEIVLATQS